MLLNELIEKVAFTIIEKQNIDGSMPAGHNGPYNDPETSVRNSSHWLFTLSHIGVATKSSKILKVANTICDFLLSSTCRPMGGPFYCRFNPEKDFSNGLMGQAWAMEGLISAGNLLSRKDALRCAIDVYNLHPWMEKECIWRRVAVDGSFLTPDRTFNHQLWFAAISSQLDDSEIKHRSLLFLDHVGQHVQLYSDGVIYHQSRLGSLLAILSNGTIKDTVKSLMGEIRALIVRSTLYSKSVGYHGFNMYAFAILKKQFPDHFFWKTKKFNKMINVSKTVSFVRSLENSIYGWPYNPPGIEFAFVGESFELGDEYINTWLARQWDHTYNADKNEPLTRNVPDKVTSAARIYEAIRLQGSYKIQKN